MYEFDDSAAAIGVFLVTMLLVLIFWIATPAHSQEAPSCGPSHDVHAYLEKQYGETVTAAGVMRDEYMEILTNKFTGSFTVLIRRLDGTACIVIGGKGWALADPSPMRGRGL